MPSHFEYRGLHVRIETSDCVDTANWRAHLSYQGQSICRVSLHTDLAPPAAVWALDSKACDFIDEWSNRSRRREPEVRELLL